MKKICDLYKIKDILGKKEYLRSDTDQFIFYVVPNPRISDQNGAAPFELYMREIERPSLAVSPGRDRKFERTICEGARGD